MAFHCSVYTAGDMVSMNHVFTPPISVHSFRGLYFALLLSPTDGFSRLFAGAAFWSHGTINLLGFTGTKSDIMVTIYGHGEP
jgi:hypothetical protein